MAANQTLSDASSVLMQAMEVANVSVGLNHIGYIVTVVVVSLALLQRRLTSISLDPREPPLLKHSIPYYGFMLGLYRKRMDYFDLIRPAKRGVVAVQFDKKTYVAWSPTIIQACSRNRYMSIQEMGNGFSKHVFGCKEDQSSTSVSSDNAESAANSVDALEEMFSKVLQGPPLIQMNVRALGTIADALNAIPAYSGLEIPNLYRWLRTNVTLATTDGLFGAKNPLRLDHSIIDALFEFEDKRYPLLLGKILLKFLPGGGSLGSNKSLEAREVVQRHLMKYYGEGHDQREDTSAFIRGAAQHYRSIGATVDYMTRIGLSTLWVSTVNTIPTMYWFFTNVMLRPQLIDRLVREINEARGETPLLRVTRDDKGKRVGAVLNISNIEQQCPLLTSCYRETIRLGNQLFGLRMVDKDTTVTDEDGTQYLLKKGHNVIWSGKSLHRSEVWDNANEFDPDRFTPEREAEKEARKRKQSYMPFGGGRHLCPGRHFAFAENLGFLAAMVVGFQLDGLKQENVRMGLGNVADAIIQPTPDGEGGKVRLCRRPGWEEVVWSYDEC
ncbi:unnamed protein product [Discula destructiva]